MRRADGQLLDMTELRLRGCMRLRVEYVPWQRTVLRLESLVQPEKTEVMTSRSIIQIVGGMLDGGKKRSDN